MRNILTLTNSELIKLRNNIPLCSIFVNDYINEFNINPREVYNFFDGYTNYLQDLMLEDDINDNDYYKYLYLYDTDKNLVNWRCCYM